MSSRQSHINQCYILHSRAYQDNSLILDCFSLQVGRISFIAKGARKSKKNTISLLQPFKLLSITYLGSKDLKILIGVEEIRQYALKGKAIYCAYYLNELLIRLLGSDNDSQTVFDLYQITLGELEQCHLSLDNILRLFEIQLLSELGYHPNLTEDIQTRLTVEKTKNYYFDPLSGPYQVETLYAKNSLFFSGKSLLAISQLDFSEPSVLKESKLLLRMILLSHLGDSPLKSREVYKQMYANKKIRNGK